MLYAALRSLLFSLDPERSHDVALNAIGKAGRTAPGRCFIRRLARGKPASRPTTLAGMPLPNPVGLAAGLDKHAHATSGFLAMGFGFVELGTVTPLPQDGNARPRMFRLTDHHALINRMGFNSVGFDQFRDNLAREQLSRKPLDGQRPAIGINIGKNAATPLTDANADYLKGIAFAHGLGDYITVNVSSPNTRDLRSLQSGDELKALLLDIAELRERLNTRDGFRQPVFIKIAPDDMDDSTVHHIVECAVDAGIDAIINTNTTVSRDAIAGAAHSDEAGGLSGTPLLALARDVNRRVVQAAGGRLEVVACGGIDSAHEAAQRLHDGASAVQVYTALIYQGPQLVRQIVDGLEPVAESRAQ